MSDLYLVTNIVRAIHITAARNELKHLDWKTKLLRIILKFLLFSIYLHFSKKFDS
jgi:hypothetical protein